MTKNEYVLNHDFAENKLNEWLNQSININWLIECIKTPDQSATEHISCYRRTKNLTESTSFIIVEIPLLSEMVDRIIKTYQTGLIVAWPTSC